MSLDGRRQHQPQRRLPANEYRRAGVLPAQHGLVAGLRLGNRKPESAWLCRHQSRAAGPGRAAVELQLSAGGLSGNVGFGSEAADRQSCECPVGLRRPAATARRAQTAERVAPRRRMPTTAGWRPGSSRSNWPIACRSTPPRHSTWSARARNARPIRRRQRATEILAGNACWHGDWSSGVSVSCRSITRRPSKRSSCQLWDQHGDLRTELANNCAATDQPVAALLKDLKARGMLEDTLVVWGGEFGRTPRPKGRRPRTSPVRLHDVDGRRRHQGRHDPRCTDEFGWHALQDKVHVHDLHATILHLMGIDHTKLTYRYAGRNFRLTDVYGEIVRPILA